MKRIFIVTLKQLANITVGYPFRGRVPEVIGGDVCVIQMKDVSLAGIDWSGCIKTELKGKRSPGWLQENDILFIARGSRNHAALVDDHAKQKPIVAAPHFYVLQCNTQSILPEYLAWFINQAPSQRYFQREAEGSVTKSIRRSILEALPIAIPSLDKQQSIVKLAQTVSKERQLMQQLIDSGEKLMSAVVNDLLQDTNINGVTK